MYFALPNIRRYRRNDAVAVGRRAAAAERFMEIYYSEQSNWFSRLANRLGHPIRGQAIQRLIGNVTRWWLWNMGSGVKPSEEQLYERLKANLAAAKVTVDDIFGGDHFHCVRPHFRPGDPPRLYVEQPLDSNDEPFGPPRIVTEYEI